jgi:hypothetical protein
MTKRNYDDYFDELGIPDDVLDEKLDVLLKKKLFSCVRKKNVKEYDEITNMISFVKKNDAQKKSRQMIIDKFKKIEHKYNKSDNEYDKIMFQYNLMQTKDHSYGDLEKLRFRITKYGDLDMFEKTFKNGPGNTNDTNFFDLFLHALNYNNKPIAKYLISKGYVENNTDPHNVIKCLKGYSKNLAEETHKMGINIDDILNDLLLFSVESEGDDENEHNVVEYLIKIGGDINIIKINKVINEKSKQIILNVIAEAKNGEKCHK